MLKMSKLLAGAIAAAAVCLSSGLSAAELKGSVYADLRYGLDYFENSGALGTPTDINFDNHGSYWGVKASAAQGGLTAFGAYERWLDADGIIGLDLVRQGYAGLMTEYGTVQFGTFATAYMESGRKLDPFYATAAAGVGSPSATIAGGQSHGQSFLSADSPVGALLGAGGGGFATNQLAYTAPNLFGATANVAVFFDDGAGENEQNDYAAGVEWAGMGITAGVQYLDDNNDGTVASNLGLGEDQEAVRLYGGYAAQRFGASVSAERLDLVGANDADFLMVSGWFGVLPGTRVAASAGMENETGTAGGAEGQSFRVGVFHDVLDNFTTHVVYRNYNNTDDTAADDQVISLGASFKFELSGTTTR
jgi:hypothetical protein